MPPIFEQQRRQVFNRDGSVVEDQIVQVDVTVERNGDTLRALALAALAANRTFLDIGTPTNAQVLAQVRNLTRQVQALIRLELGVLDDTT
jgi:hypothetical protein